VNYVKEYLEEIQEGKVQASLKIKAVYEREVEWIDNPPKDFPFYFSEEAGNRPIRFIETFCHHSKGKWCGKPFKLEPFQKAKMQLVFGWLDKETHKRRFREVVDIRGRKCGKSSETAAVELYCLVADGEAGAEVYCTANKLDQAKLVFNEAVNMRQQSMSIKKVTKKRQSDIYMPSTFSKLQALSSETKTLDGLNASFFSLDEFHEARKSDIYDVMIQSQSTREQPLAWLISTNGYVREMFFDAKYDYACKVALWEDGFHDYQMLPLIHELDNREEINDEKMWEKANPALGKIKSYKSLKDFVDKAKRDPSFMPTLLTKDFNIPENSSQGMLSYEEAINEETVDIEYLKNSYAVGGCDLSATTDLTCATLLIKKPNDENIYVLQKYFLPEARVNLVEQTNAREAPYKLWAEQGHLTICDGATVNFSQVTEWFVDMVNQYEIRPLWVAYDASLSGYWREEMEENGFDMERIRQGPFTWTYPLKRLIGLFQEKRVIYQNNPMLRWCLLNTGLKTTNKDGINSIQPVKTGSNKRIDGLVSLLNAYVGYCNHEEEYNHFVK